MVPSRPPTPPHTERFDIDSFGMWQRVHCSFPTAVDNGRGPSARARPRMVRDAAAHPAAGPSGPAGQAPVTGSLLGGVARRVAGVAGVDAVRSGRAAGRDPGFAYLGIIQVVLGLAMIFVGPALTTLRDQTGVSLATIDASCSWRSRSATSPGPSSEVGATTPGSGTGSCPGDWSAWAGLVAGHLGSPVHSPCCSCCSALMGFAASVLDVGGNTLMVWTRGAGVGPMMNALHFCFALGTLACPLLINRSLAWSGDLGPVLLDRRGGGAAHGGGPARRRDEPCARRPRSR